MTTRTKRADAIDLAEIHRVLWLRRSLTNNTIRLVQTAFAEELCVSRFTVCRMLGEMEEAGWLTSLSQPGGTSGKTYAVADPDAT